MSFWYGRNFLDHGIVVEKHDGWWFVPRSKRRPDDVLEAMIGRIVALRTVKNYAEADALRAELVSDGATVTYRKDGTVWVCY